MTTVKALVTGGAGFIGSTIADTLASQGNHVLAVDDLSRGKRDNLSSNVEFECLDICDSAFADIVVAFSPDVIFHHAAQIDVRKSVLEPLADTRINVVGTVNVLQAAAKSKVRRVVFASSGGTVYGDTEQIPTSEAHRLNPESIYGAAKVTGEFYGTTFATLYGLEFVALRYANVYGPRQDPHGEAGVVAIFSQALLAGRECTINGDGGQTRDYVYVDDVVAANIAAIDSPTGAYNIGTGIETDVNQIFASIAKACGFPDARARHGDAKVGEQRRSALDASLAHTKLGWTPQMELDAGIAKTVDFFRGRSAVPVR